VHTGCVAAAGTSCKADFDACKTRLAPGQTCELPTTGTGGGGSGGGSTTCSFNACVAQPSVKPQKASCTPCTQLVCQSDDYCCTTEWDALCVDAAKKLTECGCTTPT
jgi:hypothetical protein